MTTHYTDPTPEESAQLAATAYGGDDVAAAALRRHALTLESGAELDRAAMAADLRGASVLLAEGGDYTDLTVRSMLAHFDTGEPGARWPFAEWLAHALGHVAAELGSTNALTADRPGSWESGLVAELVKGTVGWDDEQLADFKHGAESVEER